MKLEKTCEKHGVLEKKDILQHKMNQYKNGIYLRCRKCRDERSWKYQSKTCKTHGLLHDDDIKANGRCKLCHRASEVKRRKKVGNEAIRAKIAEDKKKNPERWKAYYKRLYVNQKKLHGSTERNTREIIRMAGLSREKYDQMFIDQKHLCKICGQPETRKGRMLGTVARLVVDHCHETGLIRGLLCAKCNLMLSYGNDNPDILAIGSMY